MANPPRASREDTRASETVKPKRSRKQKDTPSRRRREAERLGQLQEDILETSQERHELWVGSVGEPVRAEVAPLTKKLRKLYKSERARRHQSGEPRGDRFDRHHPGRTR